MDLEQQNSNQNQCYLNPTYYTPYLQNFHEFTPLEPKKPVVSVIMPTFNEARQIGYAILELRRALEKIGLSSEIIVVDDGSIDLTAEIAHEFGVKVLKFDQNCGFGCALNVGIKIAKGEFIVITDASGVYDPNEIEKLILPLLAGAELVSGSRFARGSVIKPYSISPERHISILVADLLISAITGTFVRDALSSFKAFRKDSVKELNLQSKGFELPSELTIKAIRRGLLIVEVPITSA